MEPLSLLLVLALVFGGGYATSEMLEPEKICRTIQHEVPMEYQESFGVTDCKETDEIKCDVKNPKWVIQDREYKKLSGYVGGMRLHLNQCDRLIQQYNDEKFIER